MKQFGNTDVMKKPRDYKKNPEGTLSCTEVWSAGTEETLRNPKGLHWEYWGNHECLFEYIYIVYVLNYCGLLIKRYHEE